LAPPRESHAPTLAHDVVQLRDAERLIVRLRWLAMASWPPILLAIQPPVSPRLVWTAYGIAVAYVLATHVLNRNGWAVRATALGTTLADPIVTALICGVTRGLDSELYPFFYLTTLATSIRFGMVETLAVVLVNAALSAVLFVAAPGSTATGFGLAVRVFFLFFVALEGGLLSRAARRQSQRRQELLRRLIRAEEDERRRLAGELHDRVGRRFFEFYSALDRARLQSDPEDGARAEQLGRLADAARGCAEEVRAVTNELRPVVLDDFGFVEALRERAAALAAEGDLAVSLEIEAPPDAGRPDTRVVLFRVLQETLANVRRHADARRVAVRFVAVNGTLELDIRDDGCGFDPGRLPRGHLGLLYMRERVEGCGGRFEVRSRPGAGTEVHVRVPAGEGAR
jgi:signal transduction histidine kinase